MSVARHASLIAANPRRGSYGIDAPCLLPVLALLFLANIANSIISMLTYS